MMETGLLDDGSSIGFDRRPGCALIPLAGNDRQPKAGAHHADRRHHGDRLAGRLGHKTALASGRLDGKPTIIVRGRNDDRVPVSFSSRPYVGSNDLQDGSRSQLRSIKVTNAEHFGTDLPGFDTR